MMRLGKSIFLVAALALVALTGISAGPPGPPEGVGPPPGIPGLGKAGGVANHHATKLLEILGVEGVGAGLTAGGEPAVVILLESPGVAVPGSLDGFPVITVVTGKITALVPPPAQASFTYSCSVLDCTFDGSSSTGRKLSFAWDFGDGTGTGKVVSHTYGSLGTYAVTLTVTDKDGNYNSTSETVTVSDGVPPPPPPPSGDANCYATGQTTVRCQRPVPIGVSTGHPAITAGTIGARVVDGLGNVYALSNNHVYADENLAGIGDNVLQPGTFDGGVNPDDAVGTLAAFGTIIFDNTVSCNPVTGASCNVVDAAIALSSTNDLGNSTVDAGYGAPKAATAAAFTGQKVQKCGRTSGCTNGRIYGTGFTVDVGYDSGTARFIDQIVVIGGGFSHGGDSGSLVVTKGRGGSGGNPVGLLFAGSSNSTIINPIDSVLTEFGVAIDGN